MLQLNRLHTQRPADRHELRRRHRQPMAELAEMRPIDGHFEAATLRQHDDLERLASVYRTAAVALLTAPDAGLQMVANDHLLAGPAAQVQIDVGAWAESGARLQVYGEPDVYNNVCVIHVS